MTVECSVTPVFDWNWSAFQSGKYRYIVNQGGSSSSKTYSLLQVLCLVAYSKPGQVITVASETLPALRKGALRDFYSIVKSAPFSAWITGHNKSTNTFEFSNGSQIEFAAFPSELSAKHGKRSHLFLNEANHIPYPIVRQLMMRTKGTVFIDFNPTSDFWAHEHYMAEKSALWLYSTYRDNPFAGAEIVREIEALKTTSPAHYKVYGLGKRGALTGQVFGGVVNWVNEWPSWLGESVYCLDAGYSNSYSALAEVALGEGQMWARELVYERGLLEPDLIERMEALRVSKSTPVVCDSAAPMIRDYLRKYGGYNAVSCTKKNVAAELSAMKRYRWNITDSSVNWKTEARNYLYKTDTSGGLLNDPVKTFDHLWDAARYGFLYLVDPADVFEMI